MSITLTAVPVARKDPHGKTLFHFCAYTADASSAEIIKAAPTSGKIYVTRMLVAVLAAITVTIGDGEDTSAVETIRWNLAGTAEGIVFDFKFENPVNLTAAKAMTVDASAGGGVIIEAEGYQVGT